MQGEGPAVRRAQGRARGGMVDFASGLGAAAVGAPKKIASLGRDAFEEGFDLHLRITKFTDAASEVASEDNKLVNSLRSTSRLTLAGSNPELTGDGRPVAEKTVSWVVGLPLPQIKAVGQPHGATINDVHPSVVSGGLSGYVESQGRDLVDSVSFLTPVSLKPIDMNLPPDLGIHFATVVYPGPLGIRTATNSAARPRWSSVCSGSWRRHPRRSASRCRSWWRTR